MGAFGGLLLTNKGRNLQAKAQTGKPLNFTRIAIGDGELGGTSILDLSALRNEKKSLTLTKLKVLGEGKVVVGGVFANTDITTGFYFKELGLFATDPDLGEILYSYGNSGANAEFIPAGGGADIVEKTIDLITIVGAASNVSATINQSLVFETPDGAQEKANIAESNAKAASIAKTEKGAAGGVPVLDTNGKIDNQYLSALAITDTFVVNSEAAMLVLAAQKGDVAVRSDMKKSFILTAEPATTLTNWTELQTPTDAVLSVNGKTGTVTLTPADVGAASATTFNEHQAEEVHQGEVHGLRATNGKLEYFDGTEWKTVSGGLPVGSVSNFVATSGNAKATLTWTDPVDVVLNSATIAAWAGTKILRKIGSYPVNEKDGVLVVDSAIRDQYATNGFVDTGLTNDTIYYYSAFPYTDEDIFDKKSNAQATPRAVQIYGVKIDTTNSNPSTAVTYTDGAIGFTPASGNNGTFNYGSWQDKFPFNQIKPCVLKSDLTVNYYLNPNNYAQKVDGVTASDITSGNDGDVMVEFPKIWWKFEIIGTDLYVRYADAQVDATWKCLAHKRGVTEKDKVYISAYLGNTISSKLRSLSGKTPTVSQTIGTFRTQAQANGAGFDQQAYFQTLMLQVLFIVMFKSRDSQTVLGRGYVDGNTAAIATGGANAKGLFYGETTGKQQNKFCGIEDFWGNTYYWIDGFYSDASQNMLIGTQGFNDTGSGYVNYGQGAVADISGYISAVQGGTETGFVIKASTGSASTDYADYGYLAASRLPAFGGSWAAASGAGAFRLGVSYSASGVGSGIGGRLLAL